jgi:nicotinic acid phosphoribosyltransferase
MYLVFRFNINTAGAEAHSTQKYDDQTAAMKRFYTLLASDIDNDNYQYELVQVVRDDGITIASQVFDNRPTPEPTPEPGE